MGTSLLNNIVIVLIGIFLIYIIVEILKSKNNKIKNQKVIENLIENSDTVYILYDFSSSNVLYLSKNVESILGIKQDSSSAEVVNKILNIPVIKDELKNWDKTSLYVSQMISYNNPLYNHNVWIKIKIFPYKNNNKYCAIQITDSSKEHDRQHLLITQASNIKVRENQLNQITSKSYDVEITGSLQRDYFEMKYFKSDNLYFGNEMSGNYFDVIDSLLNYINEHDKDQFKSFFDKDNLLKHFEDFELDSINFRYRIGNEVKDNIWLESTIFFISKKDKTISVLTKNVTESAYEVRKQNVLLQNALNEAKMADKGKTELLMTISHDIRTPLTNILGLSETLLDQNIDDNIKEDIKNIVQSSNDMLDVIDTLVDATKIEKTVILKNENEYSLLELFNDLASEAKSYLKNKPVEFILNMDSNLPVVLKGDSKRIKSALRKIINNSIKFTDEGTIGINVRGKRLDSVVNLDIEIFDTGVGISRKKIKNIFEDEQNKNILSVKKIIDLLDGNFEIQSEENKYTKVFISFSQKIVEDNKIMEKIFNNKISETFDLCNKKVLIVDDNTLNLKVTKKLLSQYNLDITLMESGEECIQEIKSGSKYDLILMDQMMPGLNGTEALNKLKAIEGFSTKVVVLTADAMEGQREKYLESGFDDYISKPIDKKELSRVLKKFLAK